MYIISSKDFYIIIRFLFTYFQFDLKRQLTLALTYDNISWNLDYFFLANSNSIFFVLFCKRNKHLLQKHNYIEEENLHKKMAVFLGGCSAI